MCEHSLLGRFDFTENTSIFFFTIYERQETVKCFVFRKESKILGAHSEVVNSS